jgi:hypothetical protein
MVNKINELRDGAGQEAEGKSWNDSTPDPAYFEELYRVSKTK